MRDRGGQLYLMGTDIGPENTPVVTHVVSPTRQAKKELGLSGRQYKKFRKEQRRLERATTSNPLEDLVHGLGPRAESQKEAGASALESPFNEWASGSHSAQGTKPQER